MTPVFAQSGGTSVLGYYLVAAFVGLSVAFVFRGPKDMREGLQLLALSFGGLILLALGLGAVNTWAPKSVQQFVGQPVTQAGLVGASIALGGFVWGVINETAKDAQGLNVFELLAWFRSGGKQPRRARKP